MRTVLFIYNPYARLDHAIMEEINVDDNCTIEHINSMFKEWLYDKASVDGLWLYK